MGKVSLDNRVVNILNRIHAGVLYCKNDEYSTILYANDYFYQMIGYEKDEFAILFRNRFADLVVDDVSHILASISEHIAQGKDLDFDYRMRNKKGEIFWVHDTAKYEYENDCWYVTIMDITEMKSIEYERERLEFYLNNMPNKIVICDKNEAIVYKNKCVEECIYYDKEASSLQQLIGDNILGRQLDDILKQASGGDIVEYETRYQENGIFVGHDKNRMIPIKNQNDEIISYMQVSEDLLNKTDGLTHFPTRPMFEYYYNYFVKAHRDKPVHLMILDLDEFKKINDTYGHHIGDEVIRSTGHKLTAVLGKEDYICRFGGDEFLILFVDQGIDIVLEKCRYILSIQSRYLQMEDKVIEVNYSVGIASKEKNENYKELLEKADKALYHVKENGKGGVMIYGEGGKCVMKSEI